MKLRCIEQYNAAPHEKHHRVSVHILDPESPLRADVDARRSLLVRIACSMLGAPPSQLVPASMRSSNYMAIFDSLGMALEPLETEGADGHT